MDSDANPPRTKPRAFVSYAHADEANGSWKSKILPTLRALQRNGVIEFFEDEMIGVGEEWDERLRRELDTYDLIIFLVSTSFIGSGYIDSVEVKRALERHETKEAFILPILLKPCDWTYLEWAKVQAFPRRGPDVRALSNWEKDGELDDALLQLSKRIREWAASWRANRPTAASLGLPGKGLFVGRENEEPADSFDWAPSVSHARQLAQGEFYIPLREQIAADVHETPIHLRLIFLGTAKITTRRGTIVFSINAAELNINTSGGRIVKMNSEFDRGWEGKATSVRAIPANAAGEIAYRISSIDQKQPLSGNVLMTNGDDTHVRLFDISADDATKMVKVHGSVAFDVEGVRVHLKQSKLKTKKSEDQDRIELMQARLAACVLKECKDRIVEIPEVAR